VWWCRRSVAQRRCCDAVCRCSNFPSQIEHCIEWARAEFHTQFVQPFQQALKIIVDPAEFISTTRREYEGKSRRGDKVRGAQVATARDVRV
jgi:hypothetical protein